ncbi:MAG: DUF1573 domain-containing protein [Candidatus Binataceae bacterium]
MRRAPRVDMPLKSRKVTNNKMYRHLRFIIAAALSIAISLAPFAVAQCANLPVHAQSLAQKKIAGPQPKLVIAHPVYNFGGVLNGPPVGHTFTIRNAGDAELIIGQVIASCGCTAAKPTRTHIPPGQTSQIAVEINTKVLSGQSEHTVMLLTNDPQNPKAVLKLVGDVKLQVTATPPDLDFGKIAHGAGATRNLVLTALNQKGFEAGAIKNSNPNIKIQQAQAARGEKGVTLKVALLKTMPVGPFVDTINISTNRAPVAVSVFGSVTGEINVDPPQVSFGLVPHRQSAMRIVRLVNSGKRDVKLIGISTSNDSVIVKVQPIAPGRQYKITLRLRENTPDGQVRGQLVLKTDDPEQPTVTIPYYGIIGSYNG